MLEEQGWLDGVPTVPWEDGGTILTPRFAMYELNTVHHLHTVHPSLQFISHIPQSITGEQLVNQFLRCIPDNTWLFKYGRVPLNLIMGGWVWQVGLEFSLHPSIPVRFFVRSFGSIFLSFRFCFISTLGGRCNPGPMPALYTFPLNFPPTRPSVPFSVPTLSPARPCLRKVTRYTD